MSPPSPSSPSPFKRSTSLPSPTIKKSRSLPSTSLKTPKDFLTEHTRIIGSIRALDHVPTSLAHQTDLVKSLEGRLDLARWRMEKKKDQRQSAIPKRGNSIKRNESWRSTGSSRESIGWRLINKVSRRKGSTSDEEYVEDNPMRDQTLYGLEEELRQAKTLHAQLLDADRKHSLLRAELDRFYSAVLHLAELELPHKDELEERMNLAQTAYDRVQETFNSEVHALESLTKAGRALIDCQHKLQEAVEYCTFGLPGRGSMINTLEGVHVLASVIQAHIQQAQYVSPAVARFAPLTIPQGCVCLTCIQYTS
ncbi:hypothetical protein BDN72DRAFT_474665 [Pluteus cervinus]|uniref:Uncharacterized protein n=1 Tax=Pluteus cervinus TaxID=181527 RepID=A0ACD3B1T4_9AGAR|nr:hypothetical protein BDN72DRAFT_474665 [Pluteus cervinus]